MSKVTAQRSAAAARKAAALMAPVSKADLEKIRAIVHDAYGTVFATIKIASIVPTEKANIFKVQGSIDYEAAHGNDAGARTNTLKATVNTKTEGIRGNIPIDP
jgi:hypothetical protein